MVSAGYPWRPPPLLLLLLMVAASALLMAAAEAEKKEEPPLVPALFVFGDSLVDNGNNNGLPSLAKANYLPYGVDFGSAGGGSPTGRFCNGYTIVDYLAELLGLPLVPPYSQLLSSGSGSGSVPTNGANYASAAAGILDDSGANFAGRIPFDEQISNFERTVAQIAAAMGTNSVVGRSMVFVGMGSNDYLNNYLMPNYDTRRRHTPAQFSTLLLSRYAAQLTRLYRAGARRFVVAGLGSLGCIPTILARTTEGRCDEQVDRDLVGPFNAGVKAMLDRLNNDDGELPGARFAFLDNYRIVKLMLADPAAYGFAVVDRGCCGVGLNAGQMTCLPFMEPCAERGRYLFWDAYHPTAAVNEVIARAAFDGGEDVVFPVNVRRLAQL